ncbi:alpha/beta fold hydrolase [Chitinophaga silvatica]|nr:alpha/beta fold hydrolase [Chitinophaga silvatica]
MKRFHLLLVFLLGMLRLTAQQKDQVANQFFTFLSEGKWEDAYTILSPKSQTKISVKALEQLWNNIGKQYGPWKSYSSDKVENVMGKSRLLISTNTFEYYYVDFKVSVNSEEKIERFSLHAVNSIPLNGDVLDSVTIAGGKLYGSLSLPTGIKKCPVVLILPGSGPTDKDGDSKLLLPEYNHAYQFLAKALAEKGIASLRFDKRGIGANKSFTDPAQSTLDNYDKDAITWLKYLKQNSRFSDVYIMGHSEGGVIAIDAALAEPVKKVVLLSTPAESLENLLVKQFKPYVHDSVVKTIPVIFRQLSNNEQPTVPNTLNSVFNKGSFDWLKSHNGVVPADRLAELRNTQVIIINGTIDTNVPPAQAEMLHKSLPSSKLLLIPGMSHLLRMESDKEFIAIRPLASELISAVSAFLKK